jgi:RNA polymerase sigma-70 factor, ECF subfamily
MIGMPPESFAETLAAAQHGDEAAFTTLFRETQPSLLRYLRVVAPDRAEDIAGDTWVRVVHGLASFVAEEPLAFRAWVLSIGRHRWIDDVRARQRRPESPVADLPEQAGPMDVESAVFELMTTESALALIARLPRDQAEVVLLRVVAGLDVARTAELLGKQPGAVRVLSHRGLRGLHRMLTRPDERREGRREDSRGVSPDQV